MFFYFRKRSMLFYRNAFRLQRLLPKKPRRQRNVSSASVHISSLSHGRGMGRGLLPLIIPDVHVAGCRFLDKDFALRGDDVCATPVDNQRLCHHVNCAELYGQHCGGNICLFHHSNLQFDNLLFTIYLPFNYLVIYLA